MYYMYTCISYVYIMYIYFKTPNQPKRTNVAAKVNQKVAQQLAMANVAEDNFEAQAPWIIRIHSSHACRQVGGVVFCTRCGAVAMVPRSRSRLFGHCKAEEPAWRIPNGSLNRLERLKKASTPRKARQQEANGQMGCQPH